MRNLRGCVDTQRNPLSGATFLLEWSEDGALWWPVTFSETAIKGGCANADLVDGMLTSGEDGILEWTNLHVYTYGIDLAKLFSDGKGDFSKVEFLVQNKTDNYYVRTRACIM